MMKVALLGYGNMAKNHFRVLNRVGVSVDAILEPDVSKHADIGTKFYTNLDEMVSAHEHFDAVIVATSSTSHNEIVSRIYKNCNYIFIEKPAVVDPALLEKLKGRLFIGFIEKFNPSVIASKEFIAEGNLGKIKKIDCTRVGGLPRNKAQAINVIWDLAIHDFSILEELTGEKPKLNLLAHTRDDGDVITSALVGSFGETNVTIDVSWDVFNKKRLIEVYGEKGLLTIDLAKQTATFKDAEIQQTTDHSFLSVFTWGSASSELKFGIQNREPLELELGYFLSVTRENAKFPVQHSYRQEMEALSNV